MPLKSLTHGGHSAAGERLVVISVVTCLSAVLGGLTKQRSSPSILPKRDSFSFLEAQI